MLQPTPAPEAAVVTQSALALPAHAPTFGWLRSAPFDLGLVVATAAIALAAGALMVKEPWLLAPIAVANMWLLGFHHVVATFTRIAFSRQSLAQNRFLLLGLPPILLAAVVGVAFTAGAWVLATVYLYWQAFHYTRQSYGIAQAYARRPEAAPLVSHGFAKCLLYGLPLAGILYRSYQNPSHFLGLEIWCLPVPKAVAAGAVIACGALICVWAVQLVVQLRRQRLALGHAAYLCSHVAVFSAGYFLIDDMDVGWLVLNIWHNAQYVLFVWHANNRQFGERVDPRSAFLSRLSRRRNVGWYFLTCLALSTLSYGLLLHVSDLVALSTVSLAFLVAQAINYHHYIVDGLIWRRPKPAPAAA